MKTILLALFTLAFLSSSSNALELVSASHRDANSFKRISEYLSGDENPGRYTLLRSKADQRDGFYLSLKLSKEERASIKSIRLLYVEPASLTENEVKFEITTTLKARLLVGLTEAKWSDDDSAPLAWRIETLDTSGNIITHHQSFLWSPK